MKPLPAMAQEGQGIDLFARQVFTKSDWELIGSSLKAANAFKLGMTSLAASAVESLLGS